MQIRDRIKELRRVPARSLQPHPRNWRTHPPAQHDALRSALADIGYADALLARELADGSLQLIDGHLRAETAPDALAPVLVLDVDEQEAERILLTLDPLASLAGADAAKLDDLLSRHELDNEALRALLEQTARDAKTCCDAVEELAGRPEAALPETYQVVVECQDEREQERVYRMLQQEGLQCRLSTLA